VSDWLYTFVSIDLPAMLAGTLAAVASALLGNFLVLRRQSLMGDAISHAVLPGLVGAFLLTGSRATLPMLIGAMAAGVATVLIIETVKRIGRVESGAAMGVVFSILFALGVLLLEQAAARQVDLDAQCVLYGQLEIVFWLPPREWEAFLTLDTLSQLPRQVTILVGATLLSAAFVGLFFKELRICSFDPGLATTLGFPAGILNVALMVVVAIVAVASFEAVGSILVIAMLICPAATARLLTDRLAPQVWTSVGVALLTGAGGYLLAAFGPNLLGFDIALNAAGSMATLSGILLALAIVFAPLHGVVPRELRRLRLGVTIAREDLLGLLYRLEEDAKEAPDPTKALGILGGGATARLALRRARRAGEVRTSDGRLALTHAGREAARSLVRSHRLWESYLVSELGYRPDHVHETAERLEHLKGAEGRLAPPSGDAETDPHERPIPDGDASARQQPLGEE